ncbi:MAG: hypothetical protein CSA22_09240 [Deltaproteobacteria bacterium]|nr:MAG: hypothetical protein CSA22_09240 [Deltaproteobacteria bacterium]
MDAGDREILNNFSKKDFSTNRMTLVRTSDALPEAMATFAEEMASALPGITLQYKKETEAPLPGIRVRDNLLFCAAPSGPELPPFLSSLLPPDPEKNSPP